MTEDSLTRLDRIVKLLGSARSRRDWHDMERAHEELRDHVLPGLHDWRERAEKAEAEVDRLVKSRNKWGRLYNDTLAKLRSAVMSDSEYVAAIDAANAEAIARAEKAEAALAEAQIHHELATGRAVQAEARANRIERETIERCARVADEIAERHREASSKCHEEGLKDASQLASYAARSVDDIAAAIRAMRSEP